MWEASIYSNFIFSLREIARLTVSVIAVILYESPVSLYHPHCESGVISLCVLSPNGANCHYHLSQHYNVDANANSEIHLTDREILCFQRTTFLLNPFKPVLKVLGLKKEIERYHVLKDHSFFFKDKVLEISFDY